MNRWLSKGLNFKCTQCGVCCSGFDREVWVNAIDVARLAKALKLEIASFLSKYVETPSVKGKWLLRKQSDMKSCVFLDTKKRCSVYSERPIQVNSRRRLTRSIFRCSVQRILFGQSF